MNLPILLKNVIKQKRNFRQYRAVVYRNHCSVRRSQQERAPSSLYCL